MLVRGELFSGGAHPSHPSERTALCSAIGADCRRTVVMRTEGRVVRGDLVATWSRHRGACPWQGVRQASAITIAKEASECMRLITYQALLSNPDNLARVQAARRAIERAGGRVTIAPPTKTGMVAVILELPEGQRPDDLVPGIPFYPV